MKKYYLAVLLNVVTALNLVACNQEKPVSGEAQKCQAKTCQELGITCGKMSDGCGHKIDCGECPNECITRSCEDRGYNCDEITDDCGRPVNCGTCSGEDHCVANVCGPAPLPYPSRGSIKGLNNDLEAPSYVIVTKSSGTPINFIWENWQPVKTSECSEGQVKYDGYCYTPDLQLVSLIEEYSAADIVVTGIFYGVPEWARRECQDEWVILPFFCAPTEEGTVDYARFVGFIAHYFNGHNGHGRVADFVIHNEVNSTEWFNYGCTTLTCDLETWTDVYALNWNMAYDWIMREQPYAKVLISLTNTFGTKNDAYTMLAIARPYISDITLLKSLIPKLGDRTWRLAYHAYPPALNKPEFSADDYPLVTPGNIGILLGWLHSNYPDKPESWEVQLTEQGISGFPDQLDDQAKYLCQAFRNYLGTPGIESYLHGHIRDFAHEAANGMSFGLIGASSPEDFKPAWYVFGFSNQDVPELGYPNCGFELANGHQIRMVSGFNSSTGYHWITSRMFPSGFTEEQSWILLRDPAEKTAMLYECRIAIKSGEDSKGKHAMASLDPNCEGHFSMGPMGYIYTEQLPGTIPLYNCYIETTGDHIVSSAQDCAGNTNQGLLGYALTK